MIRGRDITPGTWICGSSGEPQLVTDVAPGHNPPCWWLCLTIDGERRLRMVHVDAPVATCPGPEAS